MEVIAEEETDLSALGTSTLLDVSTNSGDDFGDGVTSTTSGRLRAVKRTIQKLSNEALQRSNGGFTTTGGGLQQQQDQSLSTTTTSFLRTAVTRGLVATAGSLVHGNATENYEPNATVETVATADGSKGVSSMDHGRQHQPAVAAEEQSPEDDDDDEDEEYKRSFHLGMELFGEDARIVEKTVQDKLVQVEKELQVLELESSSKMTGRIGNGSQHRSMDLNMSRSDSCHQRDDDDVDVARVVLSPEQLESEASYLKVKVSFLRECSKVRALVDESERVSSESRREQHVDEGYSIPDYVESAKFLLQAQDALSRAEKIVETQVLSMNYSISNSNNMNQQSTTSFSSQQQQQQQPKERQHSYFYQMIDSLRVSIRRQKVLLIRRTKSLFHSCIAQTPQSLSVRGWTNGTSSTSDPGSSASLSTSQDGSRGCCALEQVFETLGILSEPTTFPPESDDYDDGQDDVKIGSDLEDVLRSFVKTLHEEVFVPVLENQTNGRHYTYDFRESEEKNGGFSFTGGVASASIMTSTGTVSNKALGPVRRLEWNVVEKKDRQKNIPRMETISESSAGTDTALVLAEWKETFAFLQHVLSFVVDRILLNNSSLPASSNKSSSQMLCAFVGKRLFGKPGAVPKVLNLDILGIESRRLGDDHGLLLEPLIDRMRKTCIPSVSLKGEELIELLSTTSYELRKILDPFMDFLVNAGLVPSSQRQTHKFATFASSCQQQYVDNRRCVVLDHARRLLLETDYHNTVVVGEPIPPKTNEGENDFGKSVFELHQSAISKTAHSILQLCRETMDEAVEQYGNTCMSVEDKKSPLLLLPAVLYRSARETLDLFRYIIPVKYGYEIQNVPRTAAVFHNDCVYFAHDCLTLGLEYRNSFAKHTDENPDNANIDERMKLITQHCMFVDMVPLFRDLADRSMGDMLDLQAKQLAEIVGTRIPLFGKSLAFDEILEEWSEAEAALTAGLYHLRHLFQAWKPVLSNDILTKSIWYLSDVIFTLFLDEVLKAREIKTNAGQFVSTLFQKATSEIQELAGAEQDTSDSRVWDRFVAVGRFMEMNLSDIQVELSRGMFRKVTSPELSRLIVATFADSPKRQALLDLLVANS